jgi:plastocyanin
MRLAKIVLAVALCPIVGCGGGGGGGGTNPPPPAAVSSIALSRTLATIRPTETVVITATPKDANGNSLSDRTVIWTVSPTTGTASLTPNGNSVTVTGTANGQAIVTATAEQKSATATINVTSSFSTSADVQVGAGGALAFDPAQVDIAAGGTVNYAWNGVTHNVTFATPGGTVQNIPDRSSGTVQVTFGTAGTFNYQCTIHPGMNGTVTVH